MASAALASATLLGDGFVFAFFDGGDSEGVGPVEDKEL